MEDEQYAPYTKAEWEEEKAAGNVIYPDDIPSNRDWLRFNDPDSPAHGVLPANWDATTEHKKRQRDPTPDEEAALHTASKQDYALEQMKHLGYGKTPPVDLWELWRDMTHADCQPGRMFRVKERRDGPVRWLQVMGDKDAFSAILGESYEEVRAKVRNWVLGRGGPEPFDPEHFEVYVGDVAPY